MPDLEIRPTLRFILAGYIAVGLVELAALILWINRRDTVALVALALACLLVFWPLARHIERQRIRCRLEGPNLRYQYGLLSTTVKTIPVAKIQDVTVSRSIVQRLWGVGNLRIETAGQSGALEIADVEQPEMLSERVLAAAQAAGTPPHQRQ